MHIFESLLILLGIAVLLLQAARRFNIPYPVMMAFAGILMAAMPWTPHIAIGPHLALAIFITPAIFDAAYDTSRNQLLKNWLPLTALVVFAVILTTAVVAYIGWAYAGLPIAAAITLGAIVSPPDAVAVSAVLSESNLSKHTALILKGESLLNDAVALLIFGAASSFALNTSAAAENSLIPLLLEVPGGGLLGWIWARIYLKCAPMAAQALSATILEFAMTFGIWIIAERLNVSPILAVVFFAMTIAKIFPEKQKARDRVHSYSVWDATVFILNVLAFLMMGLMARQILLRIERSELFEALTFAGIVLAAVIGTRLTWVLFLSLLGERFSGHKSFKSSFLVSWCGIRGLLTIATPLALPANFPQRDLIVLTAFSVVVGTLVIQGLTLFPLIRYLKLNEPNEGQKEIREAHIAMLDAALQELETESGAAAEVLKTEYTLEKELTLKSKGVDSELGRLRLEIISAKRKLLTEWRRDNRIDDHIFHALEEKLDWAELASTPDEGRQLFNA